MDSKQCGLVLILFFQNAHIISCLLISLFIHDLVTVDKFNFQQPLCGRNFPTMIYLIFKTRWESLKS
ncbi:hypothetical protein H5410_020037 [Solanum commersonii]|uniref:Uncharacterized protein n=1 Tax=Solanum commersonii TaxID=4109 RepID=A0A9J5ZBA9_SOLCO|nr:hypothetical protein H5410_020037 [Solanum commersonii]